MLHEMRQNDRRPYLTADLYNYDGSRVDLSGADRVEFTLVESGNKYVKLDGVAATILDAAIGRVRYLWADGDTDTAGEYLGWFTVYWDPTDDTDRETFPNGEQAFIEVYITFGNDE